jgi:hypothetical protein
MPRMADGRGVVVDVRADDRMRAASAPFAMGKFALRGLAQSSVEVRLTPSFRATSTAVSHSSSGIDAFPLRFRLHSSKRSFAASRLGVLLRGMAFLLAGCPAADRPYQLNGVDFMQACRKDTFHQTAEVPHSCPRPFGKRVSPSHVSLR